MIKNYWTIAWRNLLKDRQFTFLNLIGLSTGLACTLLIYWWVSDERGVDTFHANERRLYQVLENQPNANGIQTGQGTNATLARTLKEEMPEVEYAAGVLGNSFFGTVTLSAPQDPSPAGEVPGQTRPSPETPSSDQAPPPNPAQPGKGSPGSDESSLSSRPDEMNNVHATGHFADKDFFHVFSYPLLEGNPDQVLADKHSIVLSKPLAMRLFHRTDHLAGKLVQWQHEAVYTVSGIFEAPPANSSDQFDYVLPMDVFLDSHPWQKKWGNSDPLTYVVLKEGSDPGSFNRKITGFIKTKNPEETKTLFARRYSSGYLYGRYENGVQAGGRIEYVRLFSIIALFILVIACINFMNLSTAKASRRMKEVGIRKVVGARRGALVLQYMSESFLLTFLSLVLTIGLLILFLPAFNAITGKQIALHFNAGLAGTFLSVLLLTGLLAGSYPALYLSGFKPSEVLKGKLRVAAGELFVRKGLVVFQFSLSVILIVSVMVVYRQVQFIQTKSLGYNKDNILSFEMTDDSAANTATFLSEIRNLPGVVNASGMDHNDLYDYGGSVPWIDGKPPAANTMIQINNVGINYGMIETLGMELADGRSFSRELSSDSAEVILNQAAVDAFGLKDPVGRKMTVFYGDPERKIVGVVKNFHFQSLHESVKPFALRLVRDDTKNIMAKIKAGAERQTIAQIGQVYDRFHPGYPFEFKFLDDAFQSQYVAEKRVAVLSRYFAGLAILISCLGLFGLSAFTAERRRKEIGIRKVLGATVSGVVLLLSKDFLKLVGIAVLVAFPLAWWATNEWLKGFAYRIPIGAGIFVLAGSAAIVITFLTISFQAIKAALSNPVKAVRSE